MGFTVMTVVVVAAVVMSVAVEVAVTNVDRVVSTVVVPVVVVLVSVETVVSTVATVTVVAAGMTLVTVELRVEVHAGNGNLEEQKLSAAGYADRKRKALYGSWEQAEPEAAETRFTHNATRPRMTEKGTILRSGWKSGRLLGVRMELRECKANLRR